MPLECDQNTENTSSATVTAPKCWWGATKEDSFARHGNGCLCPSVDGLPSPNTATKLIKVPDAYWAGEGEKNKGEPGHIHAVA